MARFAQEYICLVWEVRQVFPEDGEVELKSEVLQVTRQRGRRRLQGAAGLWVVVRLLDFIQRAAGSHAKICSRGDTIR